MKTSGSLGSGRAQNLGVDQRSTSPNMCISVYQNKIQVTGGDGAVSHFNRMEKVHIYYYNLRTKAFFPLPLKDFF